MTEKFYAFIPIQLGLFRVIQFLVIQQVWKAILVMQPEKRTNQETPLVPVQQNVKKACHEHKLDTLICMLVTAAGEGDLTQVQVLVEDEQVPIASFIEKSGVNALHMASKHGNLRIVNWLIARGLNIEIEDWKGRRALHYAAER